MVGDDRVTPLVSVLMTAYNREKYIGQAIEAVLASDYPDFELIIVDDGSKDRTVEIARSYAAADSRIKLYINKDNLGDYPNRNQAAAYAAGKYLKYVDADDYIYPWGLGLLVRMMEQYPEVGWGLCSLIQIPERPYPFVLNSKEAYLFNYGGHEIFNKAPLSAILRRDAFLEVGGFSPLRMVGDFEMWHKMALHYPVLLMNDGIVWYREHNEQEMSSYSKFLMTYEQIRLQYLRHPKSPLSAEEVKNIIRTRRRNLLKSTLNSALRFRLSAVRDSLKCWSFFIGK
jgi:glycosyltransferase involved in cell wall biosynthesis